MASLWVFHELESLGFCYFWDSWYSWAINPLKVRKEWRIGQIFLDKKGKLIQRIIIPYAQWCLLMGKHPFGLVTLLARMDSPCIFSRSGAPQSLVRFQKLHRVFCHVPQLPEPFPWGKYGWSPHWELFSSWSILFLGFLIWLSLLHLWCLL